MTGCTNAFCQCKCKDEDRPCILCLNDDHRYDNMWVMMADKGIDTQKHFGKNNPYETDIKREEKCEEEK